MVADYLPLTAIVVRLESPNTNLKELIMNAPKPDAHKPINERPVPPPKPQRKS